MDGLTFFSPSYRGDLERFVLLRKSINHFYTGNAKHIVAVPKQDVHLFTEALNGDNVEVIEQNALLAPYFYPARWYPALQRLSHGLSQRLSSFAGRPGWIQQQIVKLAIPEVISDGAVAILDSDIFFIRHFDDSTLTGSNGSRYMARIEPETESGKQRKHIARSREILGLPPGSTDHHYMSCPAIWYPEWISALRAHLETLHGRPWQKVLYDAGHISEYSIYGLFVDEILKPAQLTHLSQPMFHILWDRVSYDEYFSALASMTTTARDNGALCLIVQSNLHIDAAEYREALNGILQL